MIFDREFYSSSNKRFEITEQQREEIIQTILKNVPVDYFIKRGLVAFIQDDEIIMRPIIGLNIFLSSWLISNSAETTLTNDISKFIINFKDYIDYSTRILKFLVNKGRVPEKDEAWELDIPIDEMDYVLDLINIKIPENIFSKLNLNEVKYYDKISKPIIHSKDMIREFKLEDLIAKYNLNLIDAKILPQFINDLLNLEDINKEIGNYLDIYKLSDNQLDRLNKSATKIIKAKQSQNKELSLLELARTLKIGIIETQEALYFLNNVDKIIKDKFSNQEIEQLSNFLSEALRYCHNQKKDLNLNLLITQLNLNLITANEVIKLYSMKFRLPDQLSSQEIKHFDQVSHSVIKYIKEINESPTIDDLMINLNLNIRDASLIFPFMNMISSETLKIDFKNYSEKLLIEIDDLSCKILNIERKRLEELDLIDLAYHLNTGIYSIKATLNYISWIENEIDDNYILRLSTQEKKIIEGKIKAALKYIKQNDLNLEFTVLIREVGFSLKDSHLIIGLYNNIISKEVDLEESKKKYIESLARAIYNSKKSGIISDYKPEQVFILDIANASLDDLWEALIYLKVKVMNVLMDKTKVIKTEIEQLSSEGQVQLEERYGIKIGKTEEIELSKETIKLQDKEIKFKSAPARVELKRGMDFVGGLIRYKVVIKNNTEMLINNLDVSLQMTAEHIRIIDIKPRVYKKENRAKIPNMSPKQSESIDFYLEPMICGSIPVTPIVLYLDAFGTPQMSTRESLMVISKCPPIINPGEENIAKVQNIFESKDTIRFFRSFELEHDPSISFNLLIEAINAWAGQYVSKPIYENQKPFIAEVFYYILNQNIDSDLGHREQIIIKIRVDEGNNVAILSIGAEKNPTANGILTHIWQLANARFGEVFGFEFKSLHCPECGAPLDNMDKNLMTIRCKYCKEIFEKKAIK